MTSDIDAIRQSRPAHAATERLRQLWALQTERSGAATFFEAIGGEPTCRLFAHRVLAEIVRTGAPGANATEELARWEQNLHQRLLAYWGSPSHRAEQVRAEPAALAERTAWDRCIGAAVEELDLLSPLCQALGPYFTRVARATLAELIPAELVACLT